MSDNIPQYRSLADSRITTTKPVFSVIVAVYNVENYISQTLESFKRQKNNRADVEYIIVDDGSRDRSADIAVKFANNYPNVVVVTKPNGGVGETRQLGLSLARGEWVTSVDPDDLLKADYFAEAQRFVEADTERAISILSSRVLITDGNSGKYRDSHPLGAKFKRGNRVVSLLSEPSAIQMGATVFMRVDVLRRHNLTYDAKVRPTFEDGHLVCRYLAHFENPTVGLLSTAHYYYRKRADSSSLVQSSWLKEERYTAVPRLGYLSAFNYMKQQQGYVPNWLVNIVLYDLMWYFKEDEKLGSVVAGIQPKLKREFMDVAREIFKDISMSQLMHLPVNKPSWRLRESLIAGFNLAETPARIFKWGMRDDGKRNFSVVTNSSSHTIKFYVNGCLLTAVPEGITNRIYFDEILAVEYTFALPDEPVEFFIDDVLCPYPTQTPQQVLPATPDYLAALTEKIRQNQPQEGRIAKTVERWRVASEIRNQPMTAVAFERLSGQLTRITQRNKVSEDERTRRQVEALIEDGSADRFEHAWLILDHAERADDNAEHLYRYILNNHSEVNAYFLLSKDSPDWNRLEVEGFKLLEYGSYVAMAAAQKADIVASSDAVEECIYPAPRRIFGAPRYKFVFLQHGITKDDISRWLNGKKIDLIITATSDEYRSFAWHNSPYEYKSSQVALTGFPRFDNLYHLARKTGRSCNEATRVLVMPTWRQELRNQLQACKNEKEELETLLGSGFYTHWWSFLNQSEIQQKISDGQLVLRMMLHPSMVPWADKLPQVTGVEYLLPAEHSFQNLIEEADVFLTDYSSLAFDCAFIGIPVAYFQFDREQILSGTHTYRKGYFEYERDGFGPVVLSAGELKNWVVDSMAAECVLQPMYEQRRQETFEYLDGNSSERVFKVIASLADGTWSAEANKVYRLPHAPDFH